MALTRELFAAGNNGSCKTLHLMKRAAEEKMKWQIWKPGKKENGTAITIDCGIYNYVRNWCYCFEPEKINVKNSPLFSFDRLAVDI